MTEHSAALPPRLRQRVAEFLAEHDPKTTERLQFLRARYDAGLAWLHFPTGHGGMGLPRDFQPEVDRLFAHHAEDAPGGRRLVCVATRRVGDRG